MGSKYAEEFKIEMVKEYASGKSYSQIREAFGVPDATLAGWIKKYGEECKYTNQKESVLSVKEAREMQKRIQELEKENEFLKKAAAFFAKEID